MAQENYLRCTKQKSLSMGLFSPALQYKLFLETHMSPTPNHMYEWAELWVVAGQRTLTLQNKQKTLLEQLFWAG